jgi:hypothetical protein
MGGENQRHGSESEITSIVDVSQGINAGGSYNQTGNEISFRRVTHVSTPA